MSQKNKKLHKSPLDAENEQIYADYGLQERLGRPRERILKWAALLHRHIHAALSEEINAQNTSAEKLLTQMIAKDLRLVVFYLEGILKLYRKRYPAIEENFADVKALEDQLGAFSAAKGFLALSIKHKAPAAVVAHLEEHLQKCQVQALGLVQDQWMPTSDGNVPALKKLVACLSALDFDKYKKDKKVLQAEITRRLKKFEENALDMNLLQGDFGIHELRRQLRWFPIYATALDGLFTLNSEKHPIKEYEHLLKSELADSKYSQLPAPLRETRPYELSKSLFVANNGFISELGAIKDRGEEIESLEHALMATTQKSSQEARAQAIAILGLASDAFTKVIDDAQIVFKEIERVNFRKALRKDVEKA